LVLLFSAVILSWSYQERIAKYAIGELNKQIRTPVKVEKIKFTLIRKFPDAAIRLKNVFVQSVKEDYEKNQFTGINTDTLLFAKDVFLQFNLIRLLQNQYIIKEIQIQSGNINLYTDLKGQDNYRFWKITEDKTSSGFHIKLNQVRISDLKYSQMNLLKKSHAEGELNKLLLQGDLSTDKYMMAFALNGDIYNYSSDDIVYLSDKEIIVKSKVNVLGNRFDIIKGNLQLAGQEFNVDGTITNDKELNLDLAISGSDLNLEQILENLAFLYPEDTRTKMKVKGELTFNAKLYGPLSNARMPGIESEFTLNNGLINNHITTEKFEKINLKGYFTNGKNQNAESAILKLEGVTIDYGNSKLSGNFEMMNLSNPQINYQLNAELNMVDLSPFISTEKFDFNSGKITINTRIWGKQEKPFNISKKDVINWNYDGEADLKDIIIKLMSADKTLKKINGNINLSKYLYLNNLSLVISGNELTIKGRIDNFIAYILTDQAKLWMNVNVYSPNLLVDSLFFADQNNEQNSDSVLVVFPDDIYVKGKLWVDAFNYKKFYAKNMYGEVNYQPGSLWFNTDFFSMEGEVSGNGFIEQQRDGNYAVKINSSMKQIDIRSLFNYFNNFGQTYIQDKHLKGQLNGTVNYYSLVDGYLNINKATILAESDIEITSGELIEFEPMLGLSNFIEVEELKHIRFSTLKNQVYIRNSEVLIPQMDIFSSALNLSGSGIHGFDNQFNYKISVELSDLLLNKSREKKMEFEEHTINDDGLNRTKIFLTIEGNPDNYKINYDKRAAVGALKEKLTDEKAELKTLMKEEFGLFRNDTIPAKETEAKHEKFLIEWEESVADTISGEKTEMKEKSKFRINWDDEETDTTLQIEDIN
jgi:hypothetical protein